EVPGLHHGRYVVATSVRAEKGLGACGLGAERRRPMAEEINGVDEHEARAASNAAGGDEALNLAFRRLFDPRIDFRRGLWRGAEEIDGRERRRVVRLEPLQKRRFEGEAPFPVDP